MTYTETIDYLFGRLPMFQRQGAAAYKNDLSNTIALCEALGNPQHSFKSIHVAGTNGKGSVSSALAAIFQSCGYKTGLFTSPHLKDYRERIRINGKMISESFVIDFVERIKSDLEELEPSFFELTCAMAFKYFAQESVDIAILEVGMGGRLDSTNVVIPELSVITSIGMDHQQFLGDTIEKIAVEKGGIIKENIPVIVGNNRSNVRDVLKSISDLKKSEIFFAEDEPEALQTDLKGSYQAENMRTVSSAIRVLKTNGWKLNPACVKKGAAEVSKLTGFSGRWQELSKLPRIIADVGHNEDGVRSIMSQLKRESFNQLHIVWGMVSDKDSSSILRLLPKEAIYYWCKADIPRGKEADVLAKEAQSFSLNGNVHSSVVAALEDAKAKASSEDLIFVGGSVFVVGEVL